MSDEKILSTGFSRMSERQVALWDTVSVSLLSSIHLRPRPKDSCRTAQFLLPTRVFSLLLLVQLKLLKQHSCCYQPGLILDRPLVERGSMVHKTLHLS